MPTNQFSSIFSALPSGRWQFSEAAALVSGEARYLARFRKSDFNPSKTLYHQTDRLSCVCDRATFTSAIADMENSMARRQKPCDRNLMLEAAAAFYGLPSWDALSAILPRVVGHRDTAEMLRKRGFKWASSGGSLMLGGSEDEAQGWVWVRSELESEREGLRAPFVNVAAFAEDYAENGVPEAPPDYLGFAFVEICRDAEGEDLVKLPFIEALDAIDRKLYLNRPAWIELKRKAGSSKQSSDDFDAPDNYLLSAKGKITPMPPLRRR